MSVARSILLFAVAALFEIGGGWLVWQGVREHRGWIWAGLGVIALVPTGLSPLSKTIPSSAAFWPPTAVCLSPGRWPGAWHWTVFGRTGAAVCLAGVGVIMYAPRGR